jgi:hypothetical protein
MGCGPVKTRWAVVALAVLGLGGCGSSDGPELVSEDAHPDRAGDATGEDGIDGAGFGEHWVARYAAGSTPVLGAAALGNGNILVAGTLVPGGPDGIWIMTLDPQGRVLRRRVANGFESHWADGSQAAGALISLADGGALLAAHLPFPGTGDPDIWLARTDRTGEIVWQRTYGDALEETMPALAELPDGSLALVAISTSFNGPSEMYGDVWVATLDADGAILRQFGIGGAADDRNPGVVVGRDGRRYVSISSHDEDYASDYDVWLLALEADDTIAWQRRLGGDGRDNARVRAVDDEGFLLIGNTSSSSGFDYPTWIARTSYSGEVLWQRVFHGDLTTSPGDARATTDGYLLTGAMQMDVGLTDNLCVGWVVPVALDGRIGTPTLIRDSPEGLLGETAFPYGDDTIFVATDGPATTSTDAEVLVARMSLSGDRPADCPDFSTGTFVEGEPATSLSDALGVPYFTNGTSVRVNVVFRDELPTVERLCGD